MKNIENSEFSPDWASPPSNTVVDILREQGTKLSEFNSLLGWDKNYVKLADFIEGKVPIDEELAVAGITCRGNC